MSQAPDADTSVDESSDDHAEPDEASADDRAKDKAGRAEAKAAAKAERRERLQAKREARMAARAAKRVAAEAPTEPDFDDSSGTERPIAIAAKLLKDSEDAEKQLKEAQASREWAAQARREATEARKAKKAEAEIAKRKAREEAAAAKFKTDEEREKEREEAAAEKAKADAASEKDRAEAAAAKAAAKREREEAKAAAKQGSRQSTSPHRTDDDIVEAPREPKKSLVERLTPARAAASDDSDRDQSPSNFIPTIAVVIGALGFVFSVVLAIGAFMVALNPQDDGGLFNLVSNVCDALVGPLRGLFSFSGANGESKEALVAWGLGALGYLVIGLFAQSLLRSRSEDD